MDDKITAWPDETKMVQVEPCVAGDRPTWKNVYDPDHNEGFVPVEYLVASAEPTPTLSAVKISEPTATPRQSNPGALTSEQAQDLAIQSIEAESLVLDGPIEQRGN